MNTLLVCMKPVSLNCVFETVRLPENICETFPVLAMVIFSTVTSSLQQRSTGYLFTHYFLSYFSYISRLSFSLETSRIMYDVSLKKEKKLYWNSFLKKKRKNNIFRKNLTFLKKIPLFICKPKQSLLTSF